MSLSESLSDSLQQNVTKLSFEVSAEQQQKLIAFVLLLHKWNKAYNLSAIRDPQQMLIKHILDSVVVTPHLHGHLIADVGTGPGLPGIPLAIMRPDLEFTLIDSLGKRIRFIKQNIHELGINNVTAVQARVEEFQAEPKFDSVLSRAFASLGDMLHWCSHLCADDGAFLALKGQVKQDELADIPNQFALVQTIPLLIPSLEGERNLIKITKNHQ